MTRAKRTALLAPVLALVALSVTVVTSFAWDVDVYVGCTYQFYALSKYKTEEAYNKDKAKHKTWVEVEHGTKPSGCNDKPVVTPAPTTPPAVVQTPAATPEQPAVVPTTGPTVAPAPPTAAPTTLPAPVQTVPAAPLAPVAAVSQPPTAPAPQQQPSGNTAHQDMICAYEDTTGGGQYTKIPKDTMTKGLGSLPHAQNITWGLPYIPDSGKECINAPETPPSPAPVAAQPAPAPAPIAPQAPAAAPQTLPAPAPTDTAITVPTAAPAPDTVPQTCDQTNATDESGDVQPGVSACGSEVTPPAPEIPAEAPPAGDGSTADALVD